MKCKQTVKIFFGGGGGDRGLKAGILEGDTRLGASHAPIARVTGRRIAGHPLRTYPTLRNPVFWHWRQLKREHTGKLDLLE